MDHTVQKIIEPLPFTFSIYKLMDIHEIPLDQPYVFFANTDEEISLVCPDFIPIRNVTDEEKGYQGFRIQGTLDFSLTGILAGITSLLAEEEIPVFAVSTFNTDYVFTKTEYFHRTLNILEQNGWTIKETRD